MRTVRSAPNETVPPSPPVTVWTTPGASGATYDAVRHVPTTHGSTASAGGGTATSWHHRGSERAASVGPVPDEGPMPMNRSGPPASLTLSASAATPGHWHPLGRRHTDWVAWARSPA